jgi:hypothetical protein
MIHRSTNIKTYTVIYLILLFILSVNTVYSQDWVFDDSYESNYKSIVDEYDLYIDFNTRLRHSMQDEIPAGGGSSYLGIGTITSNSHSTQSRQTNDAPPPPPDPDQTPITENVFILVLSGIGLSFYNLYSKKSVI